MPVDEMPSSSAAQIEGRTDELIGWITRRTAWKALDLTIRGDEDYAARFLDTVNIV